MFQSGCYLQGIDSIFPASYFFSRIAENETFPRIEPGFSELRSTEIVERWQDAPFFP